VAGRPCPNARVPNSWILSWDEETKVPRQAIVADYDAWLNEERRNKRFRDEGSLWHRQFEEQLKKHGLVLNKPPKGSDYTKAEHGITAQEQRQTITSEPERHPFSASSSGKKSYPPGRASTTSVEKSIIINTGSWTKQATCYLFPPLKDVWKKMVTLGWIMPSETMPQAEEVHDNEAMLIDHQK